MTEYYPFGWEEWPGENDEPEEETSNIPDPIPRSTPSRPQTRLQTKPISKSNPFMSMDPPKKIFVSGKKLEELIKEISDSEERKTESEEVIVTRDETKSYDYVPPGIITKFKTAISSAPVELEQLFIFEEQYKNGSRSRGQREFEESYPKYFEKAAPFFEKLAPKILLGDRFNSAQKQDFLLRISKQKYNDERDFPIMNSGRIIYAFFQNNPVKDFLEADDYILNLFYNVNPEKCADVYIEQIRSKKIPFSGDKTEKRLSQLLADHQDKIVKMEKDIFFSKKYSTQEKRELINSIFNTDVLCVKTFDPMKLYLKMMDLSDNLTNNDPYISLWMLANDQEGTNLAVKRILHNKYDKAKANQEYWPNTHVHNAMRKDEIDIVFAQAILKNVQEYPIETAKLFSKRLEGVIEEYDPPSEHIFNDEPPEYEEGEANAFDGLVGLAAGITAAYLIYNGLADRIPDNDFFNLYSNYPVFRKLSAASLATVGSLFAGMGGFALSIFGRPVPAHIGRSICYGTKKAYNAISNKVNAIRERFYTKSWKEESIPLIEGHFSRLLEKIEV
ncbi:MAG: hypothetical protein V3V78_04190 [Candidatus Woesearchaeota archaeon]